MGSHEPRWSNKGGRENGDSAVRGRENDDRIVRGRKIKCEGNQIFFPSYLMYSVGPLGRMMGSVRKIETKFGIGSFFFFLIKESSQLSST